MRWWADSPSSAWHLINRYPELDGVPARVIEVEVPPVPTLTYEQAIDLATRLIRHAAVLHVDTLAGA